MHVSVLGRTRPRLEQIGNPTLVAVVAFAFIGLPTKAKSENLEETSSHAPTSDAPEGTRRAVFPGDVAASDHSATSSAASSSRSRSTVLLRREEGGGTGEKSGAEPEIRVLAETGLGLVGGPAASLVVAGITSLPLVFGPGSFAAGYIMVGATALAFPLGTGTGVWLGGELTGGDGTAGTAILGAYAGGLVMALVSLVAPSDIGDVPPVLAASLIVSGTVGGGVAGYEISHARRRNDRQKSGRLTTTSFAVAPSIHLTSTDGAIVGLQLQF